MNNREMLYHCRSGYLFLIDNIKKYTGNDGSINHRQAMLDFYKDASTRNALVDYIEWMWNVHGTDAAFINRIRRSVKRSVYKKSA